MEEMGWFLLAEVREMGFVLKWMLAIKVSALDICVHAIKSNFPGQSETKDWVNKENFSEEMHTDFKNFVFQIEKKPHFH